MVIPIYIDEKQEGELTIEHRGAATVMRAELRDVGRVVRLSVYGEKGERAGYLGVPAPSEGKLTLTRRLSPMEMSRFPQRPKYAAEQPRKPDGKPPEEKPRGDCPQGVGRRVLWMGGKPYFF